MFVPVSEPPAWMQFLPEVFPQILISESVMEVGPFASPEQSGSESTALTRKYRAKIPSGDRTKCGLKLVDGAMTPTNLKSRSGLDDCRCTSDDA